jgi:hypothetical protein
MPAPRVGTGAREVQAEVWGWAGSRWAACWSRLQAGHRGPIVARPSQAGPSRAATIAEFQKVSRQGSSGWGCATPRRQGGCARGSDGTQQTDRPTEEAATEAGLLMRKNRFDVNTAGQEGGLDTWN